MPYITDPDTGDVSWDDGGPTGDIDYPNDPNPPPEDPSGYTGDLGSAAEKEAIDAAIAAAGGVTTKEQLAAPLKNYLTSILGTAPTAAQLASALGAITASGAPSGWAAAMQTVGKTLSDNKGTLLGAGLMAAVLADKDKKQETTVTTAVDPRSQAGLDIAATNVLNNNYTPGTGLSADVKSNLTALKTAADEKYAKDLAAGLDPNQTKAAGIALDASDPTKNVWKDALAGAKTGTEAAMLGMKDGDLKPYINEYWRTALNPQLEQYDRDTEQQKLGLQAQAAKAGAFGGSRFGLMDTELGRNRDFVRQGTISAGAKDAFDRAANLYQGDKSRAMTGAGQLSSIGSTTAGLNTGDINNLASTGAVGQAYNQNKLTKSYDEWLRQQDAQKGYGLTALSTQVNQDAVDEKNKQFATTLPGTNATSLATLAGLNKTTKTVGTAPPLLSQLAGVGTTLFGLNKLGQ